MIQIYSEHLKLSEDLFRMLHLEIIIRKPQQSSVTEVFLKLQCRCTEQN